MKRKAIYSAVALILAALFASLVAGCELASEDQVELAKAVMRSVEQSSPTDSYKSLSGKAAPAAGLSILVGTPDPSEPPADGPWTIPLSVTFTDFVPPGHEGSSVSGTVEAVLVINFDKGAAVDLILSFDGELEVTGEAAGTYVFDAALYYDFTTREYSYSGTVDIDGYRYTFKG